LILPLLLLVASQQTATLPFTFRYEANRDLQSVSVAGTFNDWNKDATKLAAQGRLWSVTVPLAPGRIEYKFVLNGSEWIVDPKGKSQDDGNGNINSVMIIPPAGFDIPAHKGDGLITASALYADTTPSYLNYDRNKLGLSVRVRTDDVAEVDAVVNGKTLPMTDVGGDELYAKYHVDIPWDRNSDLSYGFSLTDGSAVRYFGPQGLTDTQAGNQYRLSAQSFHPFLVPDWPQQTVTYQIFPDRFANGDHDNDPPNVQPWNAKPTYSNRYGGDIAGIRQHLGYLKDLGIKAIYFNPIFSGPSNHRYETTDYFKIDPEFGTNAEFINLTHELKGDGIKVVLDGVFNHSATNFFAFDDILKKGSASAFTNWYFIKKYPVKVEDPPTTYEAWFNFPSLPKLNIVNPETTKYFLTIPEYWDTHADIAGWRLDAANEVASVYWPKFRNVVKEDGGQRWIIGEIWGDGTPWLHGDMFDSVMGYQFRAATLGFFADQKTTSTDYLKQLEKVYNSYPPQVSRNLMNLLGSHDTERFLTLCHGDKNLLMSAATVQLTWPGAPSIYYGDEIGMEGGRDPDNRKGMQWELAGDGNSILGHYKALIHARNSSRALQLGDPVVLATDDAKETLAFARVMDSDCAVTAVNRSKSAQEISIPLGRLPAVDQKGMYKDVLTGKTYQAQGGTLAVEVSAEGSCLLEPVRSGRRAA